MQQNHMAIRKKTFVVRLSLQEVLGKQRGKGDWLTEQHSL